MLYQVAGGLGQQHLSSVACAHDARCPVHVQAHIAFSRTLWLARMQTYAYMHCCTIGPGMGSKCTLHLHCRGYRISGTRKSHEEGITLGIYFVPAPAVKGCTQEFAAFRQNLGIALPQLLE